MLLFLGEMIQTFTLPFVLAEFLENNSLKRFDTGWIDDRAALFYLSILDRIKRMIFSV